MLAAVGSIALAALEDLGGRAVSDESERRVSFRQKDVKTRLRPALVR